MPLIPPSLSSTYLAIGLSTVALAITPVRAESTTAFDPLPVAATPDGMKPRGEIWVATSTDEGRTWSEPRFLLANAAKPNLADDWFNCQCSYLDAFVDGTTLHLFLPHRWQQVLHLTIEESAFAKMPTKAELTTVAAK